MTAPTLAALNHVFTAPEAACDNCAKQAEDHHFVSGTNPITPILLDYVSIGALPSLEPQVVKPFLTEKLKWRVVRVSFRQTLISHLPCVIAQRTCCGTVLMANCSSSSHRPTGSPSIRAELRVWGFPSARPRRSCVLGMPCLSGSMSTFFRRLRPVDRMVARRGRRWKVVNEVGGRDESTGSRLAGL